VTDGLIQGETTDTRCQAAPGSMTPRARQACHETEPVLSLVVGSGGLAGVTPSAERGHGASSGHTVGDKRRATLRRGAASLTETVGRASFERCGRRAGEGAR
jgi:hypothetical protein